MAYVRVHIRDASAGVLAAFDTNAMNDGDVAGVLHVGELSGQRDRNRLLADSSFSLTKTEIRR